MAAGLAISARSSARRKPQNRPIRWAENATTSSQSKQQINLTGTAMSLRLRNSFAALLAAACILASLPASAQSGDGKSGDKPPAAQTPDAAKEAQRQVDEFAEAARMVSGPAGNAECVWLGRRVVGLLWRDDMDTAFRHLDLYDRFGCPGPHIQAAFRCVVRQGNIDPKSPQSLNARVHSCWLNPGQALAAAAAPATPAGAAPAKDAPGTTGAPPAKPPGGTTGK
jgi:hypothetical protein